MAKHPDDHEHLDEKLHTIERLEKETNKTVKNIEQTVINDAKIARKIAKGKISGFMNFVREQGVVGLAVGLVLGTQVKTVVDQLVASFINPIVGFVLPGGGSLVEKTASLTLLNKTQVFSYGAFINVIISFISVAAVIYFVVKGLQLDKLDKKKD